MARVEGEWVHIGDWVGFKSDREQSGQIVKISGDQLLLTRDRGFEGDYIGGSSRHWVSARECWLI